jgi:hypothetical protein
MRPQAMQRQQQLRTIAERMGPAAVIAFETNPEQFGSSLAEQFAPQVISPGAIQSIAGTGARIGAPSYTESGDTILERDPVSRAVNPVFTRTTPSIQETTAQQQAATARISALNPTLSPGQVIQNLQTGETVARGAPRILSAADATDLVSETGAPIYQNPRDEPPEAIMRREAAAEQARQAGTAVLGRVQRSRDAVGRAQDQIGFWSSGVLTGSLPFNQARANIEATLDTIKANLSFSELQEMRNNSPTGGALGGIAVRELDLLGATIASLDANQSQEELRRSLQIVDRSLGTIEAVTRVSRGEPLSPDQAAFLPPGTTFIGQDGRQRTRQ